MFCLSLFLVVAGTVLGFGAYTWLIRVTTPAAVGTYGFVNPVVALGLAWAVGDEPFSARTVAAGLTVLGAVLLIRKSSGLRVIPSGARDRPGRAFGLRWQRANPSDSSRSLS